MIEVTGNIWDYHDRGNWIVLTTNGDVRKDGACVMGRGVALQAKERFPRLPYVLGERLQKHGNQVFMFDDFHLFTLPVKHHWRDKADIELIAKGLKMLNSIAEFAKQAGWINMYPIYTVRPGCGNGGLDWEYEVKPVMEMLCSDQIVVVNQ